MEELDNVSTVSDNIDDNETVAAYVLSDGEVVDVAKSNFTPSKGRSKKGSNAIDTDEDEFGEQYASGRVYKPTLNFSNMKQFSMDSIYHEKCINQIATDCTNGWNIVTVDSKGEIVKDKDVKWSNKDTKLYNFFNDSFNMDDFLEGCKNLLVNYNTFGIGWLELTRKKNGEPAKFKLLPTETCRIARDLKNPNITEDTDQRYMLQVVNTHERLFKIFDGDRPNFMEPHTNAPLTEVIYIRNYHVMGGKYGLPDWVPALKSMVGNDKVAEYNINFFDNEAVPRFAVIVQGSKLDEDTKREIRSYFKKDLKGLKNAHKTLVLTTPKQAEIKLIPLAVEMKDGGFRFYRKDNRDEIISAHGVPPQRVQVYDSGNIGSISPGMLFNMDKIYKYSVILPQQRKLASIFNKVIRNVFGIRDKQIKFMELDIGEEKERAEIMKIIASAHEKYLVAGSMTVDQVRIDNKQIPYNDMNDVDDEIKEWARTPKPVFLIRQALLQEQRMLNTNISGQNLNETPNDFDDKTKEQTQSSFTDKQIDNLMMKRNFDNINDKVTDVINKIQNLSDIIESGEEKI